ncbi:survival motor neuron protein 1-like isoform X2 [Lineus longissimus]|uniref:survival motor neuron protein 1-like isoform X2 n=1 Tax=Lineus longissimus TaxID=88925 RepID=UPI00315DF6C7
MMSNVADVQHEGEVLFSRKRTDEEDGSDIWDDTALIKAYDNAVSKVKAGLLNELETKNGQEEKESDDQIQKASKKKQKKRKRARKNKGKWKVGMQCRAVFSEDGLVYDASILSINEDDGTCLVSYDSYGNEEEHNLSDLRRVRKRKRTNHSGDGHSENESTGESGQKFHSMSSGASRSQQWRDSSAMPPPPPPMSQSFGNTRIPFIPPPPPPPISDDPCDIDNEAMCSMLMAWYMSGYHTGYYQGLKDGRRQGANGQSPLRPVLR